MKTNKPEKPTAGAMRAADRLFATGFFTNFTSLSAAEIIDRETGLPELLAACQCGADDRMDGDLLSIVAEYLLSEADDIERKRPRDISIRLYRDWADRLFKKQVLQAKALGIAEGKHHE